MTGTAPLSDELMLWLSAYVDGALNDDDRAEVEALAARDPRVAEEIEALVALNDEIGTAFGTLLEQPVPAPVTAAAQLPDPNPAADTLAPETAANTNRAPGWRALAASLLIGAVLGGGLIWVAAKPDPQVQTAARSWLAEVAEYHQVYARQKRHLVEVPATEQPHIEAWLTNEVGFDLKVPDLSGAGWQFQGARLLVAAGKPVAQLMYTDAGGAVIALCALQNASGSEAPIGARSFGAVHMAVWKSQTGSYAIVGDTPQTVSALAAWAEPLT